MSPRQRERPGGESQALSASLAGDAAHFRARHRQRLAPRRASLALDRLLDVYPYRDPRELYGVTPALARMLEVVAS
jgi:hypothetical protein